MAPGMLPTQVEALLAVYPVGPLMIDAPALAPKQNLNPTISISNPRLRDLSDPQPQGSVVLAVRKVTMGRAPNPNNLASSSLADPIGLFEMLHAVTLLGWLQNFFESTSWSICLSKLRSATMRLSRRFSSSSCLKRRSSDTPSPPYFFFQR
jgi:hypothetical protein